MFLARRGRLFLFALLALMTLLATWLLGSCHEGAPTLIQQWRALASLPSFPRELGLQSSAIRGSVEAIRARMEGPLHYDDPQLLALIREQYLEGPSSEPYHLMEDDTKDNTYRKYKEELIYLYARSVVLHFFKDVRNGVFVEAGALDGEYLSNTLRLEEDQGWTGLLVEPDFTMYQHVLRKKRKAWVSNCCLATKPFPHKAVLTRAQRETSGTTGGWQVYTRGQAALIESSVSSIEMQMGYPIYEQVQCLPLASILLALNITKVDYISLDVEGVEESIIEHFPFDRIEVDVWYIEHNGPNSTRLMGPELDQNFISKFTSRGFIHHYMGDYIFVRNGSAYSNFPQPKVPVISTISGPQLPDWLKEKQRH